MKALIPRLTVEYRFFTFSAALHGFVASVSLRRIDSKMATLMNNEIMNSRKQSTSIPFFFITLKWDRARWTILFLFPTPAS
jgi:hypothetical protein